MKKSSTIYPHDQPDFISLENDIKPAENGLTKSASVFPGWKKMKLGEICEKVEAVKRKEKKQNEEFLYIDIGGVDNLTNKIIGHKSLQWKDAPSRAQQIICKNDVLFSTVRTYLKNIAFVDSDKYSDQIASSGFTIIRAKANLAIPKYLFYYSISNCFLIH